MPAVAAASPAAATDRPPERRPAISSTPLGDRPPAANGRVSKPVAAVDQAADGAGEAAAQPTPSADAGQKGQFQLQAISQRDGEPVAVINERLVREGDSFDGVRILKIGADHVEIEVRGHRRVVRF